MKPICLLLTVLLFSFPLNSKSFQNANKNAKPLVVIVKKVHGHITYTVDSKPASDPLRALGMQVEQRGEDWPVIVLDDWDVSLEDVTIAEDFADKAGFKNIRSFAFDSTRRYYISEIKFGPAIHFTGEFLPAEPRGGR